MTPGYAARMPVQTLFPTLVYAAPFGPQAATLNRALLRECLQLRHDDRAGRVVLFESWLRHEVPPNQSSSERVSISFNYSWF